MKNEIAEAIKKLAGINDMPFIIGEVSDVTDRTCTVTPVKPENADVDEAEIKNVRLNAYTQGDKGAVIKPKDGTYAIVGMISPVDAVMIMCYEIETIDITMDNTTISITDGEILLNGGNNGGLIVIADLVSKINDIENDINSLKQVFSSWVTVPQDGGAALKTASTAWAAQQIVNTQAGDIENSDIKH